MKKLLKYKGFTGSIDVDLEENSLYGKILFISDLVTYEASSVNEIKQEFESAVDDYLETCAQLGRDAKKPCSGTFNIRIGPENHQKLAIYSVLKDESINSVIKYAIERFIDDPEHKTVIHNYYHEAPVIEVKAQYPNLTHEKEGKPYVAGIQ